MDEETESEVSRSVSPADSAAPLPFEDLIAPTPTNPSPPALARWLAFGSILLGGGLGALVGFGIGDLMGGTSTWAAVGALCGGLTGAIGVGVVANLTLRAMNEWRSVQHPEADTPEADAKADRRSSKQWTRRPST